MSVEGRHIEIRGVVQGVGFRPWVWRVARERGVTGWVRNDPLGVTIEAFGEARALDEFLERLRYPVPPAARVNQLDWQVLPCERGAPVDFRIVASGVGAEHRVSIPPDIATCAECLAEMLDPADRRHRYPFINCTNCGPRYTIACYAPYDRVATTMTRFTMCADCAREYQDPADRRYHAQPDACPRCGPRLELRTSWGEAIAHSDPLAAAAEALKQGKVVAVKGLGGWHLACDAVSETAVETLRTRKRRDEKPFAVLVADLDMALEVGQLSGAELELLAAPERPIVIVERAPRAKLASAVAPGLPLVGLLLPYSALHHLLAREVGRPLVLTSGNLSDEPIAYRDADAVARLSGIADLFLGHDREIAAPCEDSVARVIAGRRVVLRRSRGWVPRAIPLARRVPAPILACGGQLKNAPCLARDDFAVPGPHVGDLDDASAAAAFARAVVRLERFVGVAPDIVAHDLHPDFASSVYARGRPERVKVAVQHHHAHVASAMAEHQLEGRVLGVAWDGFGLGSDGGAWGGELLLADLVGFERLATLRPIRLPGGDAAVREPWRTALSVLEDAYDGDPPLEDLELFRAIEPRRVESVRRLLRAGFNTPLAHGAGRWFDAMAAIGLARPYSRYEGQVALTWNAIASPDECGCYDFAIDERTTPWQIDLRPMLLQATGDLLSGRSPALVSARFHRTLGRAIGVLLALAAGRHGAHPVVLTGGCFQNPLLVERVLEERPAELEVHLHAEVPPGDGGIALGQAVVAAARIETGLRPDDRQGGR